MLMFTGHRRLQGRMHAFLWAIYAENAGTAPRICAMVIALRVSALAGPPFAASDVGRRNDCDDDTCRMTTKEETRKNRRKEWTNKEM